MASLLSSLSSPQAAPAGTARKVSGASSLGRRIATLLRRRRMDRPASTVLPFLQGLRESLDALGAPEDAGTRELALGALFDAWSGASGQPWRPADLAEAEDLLDALRVLPPGPAPLPPFPAPPTRGRTLKDLLHAVWCHVDRLGLRSWVILDRLDLYRLIPPGLDPVGRLREAAELAAYGRRSRTADRHTVDLDMLADGIMTRIHSAHRTLGDLEARSPRSCQAVLRHLPAPVYPVHQPLFDLEESGAPGLIPPELAGALEEALRSRKSARPVGSLIHLARLCAAWKRILHPGRRWIPEIDGRELAILAFEDTASNPKPWDLVTVRRLTILANQVHRCADGTPDPLPRLDDASSLWRHRDALFLAWSLGIGSAGRGRRPKAAISAGLGLLDLAAHRWPQAPAPEREKLLQRLDTPARAAWEATRSLLAPLGREALALVPEAPAPDPTVNRRGDPWNP